jgi:SAM-dependent methyltransferase
MVSTTTTAQPATTSIDYFESIYARAAGNPAALPWAQKGPSRALVNWLNVEAPSQVRCGARVAVVGCGLGEDAREVARRGYEVIGFDCSETAVRWAQGLDDGNVKEYVRADLFNPPSRWLRRFDLVVESNNVQALTPDRHAQAVAALANLMAPHGLLLVIARGAPGSDPPQAGPPWPLTESELLDAAEQAGLESAAEICSFVDDQEEPPVRRIRAVFRRAAVSGGRSGSDLAAIGAL